MTTTLDATNTVLVDPSSRIEPALYVAAAFLAGYSGGTRDGYAHDLRHWTQWCTDQGLDVLMVRRHDIDLFARHLETYLAPATVARRIGTVCGFYRYCHEEDVLVTNPGAHVRRPKVSVESTTLGLDCHELKSFLYAAEHGPARDHALVCLLGLNGLRVSEACSVDVTDIGVERGHHVIAIIGKGNKPALIPLAPRTQRAMLATVGERESGPVFLRRDGNRMDRFAATRVVQRITRRAGITKRISPHGLRHAFVSAALDAGVALRDVQIAARHADPRTTTRYDRRTQDLDTHAAYTVAAFVTRG